MEFRKGPELNITPEAYILAALALLILPLKWLGAAFLAAAVHECCHALALQLCGVRLYGITISPGGTVMETEPMGAGREALCAMAGPAGSLLLVMLIRYLPEAAICAAVQGFYNLLPILPLDGGRVLAGILRICCPRHWKNIMGGIRGMVLLGAAVLGMAGFLWFRLGIGVWIPVFLLIRGGMGRKRPCKDAHKGVQ